MKNKEVSYIGYIKLFVYVKIRFSYLTKKAVYSILHYPKDTRSNPVLIISISRQFLPYDYRPACDSDGQILTLMLKAGRGEPAQTHC